MFQNNNSATETTAAAAAVEVEDPNHNTTTGAKLLNFWDAKKAEFQMKHEEWKKKKEEEEEKQHMQKEEEGTTTTVDEDGAAAKDKDDKDTAGQKLLNFWDIKTTELKIKHEEWKRKRGNEQQEKKMEQGGETKNADDINNESTATGTKILNFFDAKKAELQEKHEEWKKKREAEQQQQQQESAKSDKTKNPGLVQMIQNNTKKIQTLSQGRYFGPVIEFPDTGKSARLGSKIAEGGFSFVFRAIDTTDDQTKYALKRIQLGNSDEDNELRQACEKESLVQQALKEHENYILPLLDLKFDSKENVCYLLFPYMPNSLRAEVNQRLFSKKNPAKNDEEQDPTTAIMDPDAPVAPWSEVIVLKLFYHLLHGVSVMHDAGYSHRDLKVDNILFHGTSDAFLKRPMLMDFGSVGPLRRSLETRQDMLEIEDHASQHTTMPYRPPELFPGGLRVGEDDLDYRLVDVWSLGCTLFAILFGASPFECEFLFKNQQKDGGPVIRVVDCTQLRVLGDIPRPTAVPAQWYSHELLQLSEWMLEKDRFKRPSIMQVQARAEVLMTKAVERELLASMNNADIMGG